MGKTTVVGLCCLAALTAGCGQAAAGSDASGAIVEAGTRVDGSVQLVQDGQGACLAVRFKQDGTMRKVPLALPAGYTVSNAVMANPMDPGNDWDGPALKDDQGNLLGFVDTGVVVAGTVVDAGSAEAAESVAACGWDVPVLVPDAGSGISVDPDGLTLVARICSGAEEPSGLENDPAAPVDLGDCVAVTQAPWD